MKQHFSAGQLASRTGITAARVYQLRKANVISLGNLIGPYHFYTRSHLKQLRKHLRNVVPRRPRVGLAEK